MAESGFPGDWKEMSEQKRQQIWEAGKWRPTFQVLSSDGEKRSPSEEEHEVKAGLFFSGWNKPKCMHWVSEISPHIRDVHL